MYTVALINTNNETNLTSLNDSNFINYKKVNDDNLLEEFINFTNMEEDDLADTIICYQEPDKIYQLCYLTKDNNKEKNPKYEYRNIPNILASCLTYENKAIRGNAMLIITYLPINNFDMYNIDVTPDDIKKILYYKNKMIGVEINGEELVEIEYEYEKINEFEDYEKLEIGLYKYNLEVFYKKGGNKNELASKLFCQDMYEKVYVFSKLTEDIYDNLSKDDIDKMIKLSTGNLDDIILSKDELEEKEDEKGRTIINSKYRILYNKYEKKYQD
jgi:hypothetical protein